jgi:hypothetical protein
MTIAPVGDKRLMRMREFVSAFWVSRSGPRLPTVDEVSIFKRRVVEPTGPVERPEVRQYRYLLRTADLPSLERLHREALASLDILIRAHILRTSQDRLLSGRDLTVDDIPGLAHLLCAGEVRTPGIVVPSLTEAALERLAHRVITLPDAEPLLEGYGGWDGVDPEPQTVPATSPVITVAPQPSSVGAPRSLASR